MRVLGYVGTYIRRHQLTGGIVANRLFHTYTSSFGTVYRSFQASQWAAGRFIQVVRVPFMPRERPSPPQLPPLDTLYTLRLVLIYGLTQPMPRPYTTTIARPWLRDRRPPMCASVRPYRDTVPRKGIRPEKNMGNSERNAPFIHIQP